jgi:DNA-directed RNA polymerase subunit H (RpoH/RPB5)
MSGASKITNSQIISKIFNSRKIILDLAKKRGFNTEDYDDFTINDILTLQTNKQLDILLTNNDTGKKIYYKYHLLTKIRPSQVQDYIEDLYQLDDPPILNKDDDLVIVGKDKPNEALKNLLRLEYVQNSYYVNIYNIHDYLFNVLDNNLVPNHEILTDEEKIEIGKKYNIIQDSNWPEISRFDPPAMAIGLRPGQVTEITRNSPTALVTKYWRLCK